MSIHRLITVVLSAPRGSHSVNLQRHDHQGSPHLCRGHLRGNTKGSPKDGLLDRVGLLRIPKIVRKCDGGDAKGGSKEVS